MERYSSPHHRRREHRVLTSSPYRKRPSSSRPSARFAHTSSTAHAQTRIAVNHKVDDIKPKHISHDYMDVFNDATCVEYGSDIAGDSEADSSFHWEDEATLFTELMDEGPYHSEEDRIEKLVTSLRAPLTELGTETKKKISSTLVGTTKHVKKVVKLIDENVDPYYGKGIQLFKKGSTAIEGSYYAREAQIQETYQATQQKMATLFGELEAEHEHRDALWTKLESSIKEIVNPVLETIKGLPAQTESTIVKLDKQLESEPKTQNSKQKLLQELLLAAS